MSSPRLFVLCPVYFDTEPFRRLRERLLGTLAAPDSPGGEVRFVVVDDSGGQDPTVAGLASLPGLTVVTPPFNLGHQRAIVFGLRRLAPEIGEDDLVVTLDADGEDRPEDVLRLLEPVREGRRGGKTVALALRTHRRETLPFKVLYFFFRVLFRTLTGTLIRTGNYAAYRGWLPRQVVFHPHFDLCYSSSLLSLNLPVVLVPCERGRRYAGESHMGYFRLLVHGLRMLMPFLDRIAVRALVAGAATIALGLLAAASLGASSLLARADLPGWTTNALLVAVLAVLSLSVLLNFIVLFALFSQSQGFSLAGLDRDQPGAAR